MKMQWDRHGLVAFYILVLVFCIGATNNGCDAPEVKQTHTENTTRIISDNNLSIGKAHRIEFEGHSYLLIYFGMESGGAVTHAESCRCKGLPAVEKGK